MLSYIEYTATAGQQNFTIPFDYLDRGHIHVYINDVETLDFTFNSATVIRLDSGASLNDVVKLRRITDRDEALVDYSNGSNLNESDLDAGVLQNLFILQEIDEEPAEEAPSGHTLDSHIDGLSGQSIAKGTMRVYNADSKWAEVSAPGIGGILIGDTVVDEGVRWLTKGSDGNILQVSDAQAGKLQWVSGFKNLAVAIGDILYASAVGVYSRLAVGTKHQSLVAVPGTGVTWISMFTTGDVKLTLKTSADTGWVLMDDKSIGNGSSGATGRANADTEDLFTLLWTNVSDTYAPVSGGRGASAAADFAANKTLTLPKTLGRALAVAGAGAGLTSRALGLTVGSEDAVVVAHDHSVTDAGHAHTYANAESGGVATLSTIAANAGNGDELANGVSTNSATTGVVIDSEGVSGTGANMQPSSFFNVMVKL